MRKTKIVATLGPASNDATTIRRLITNGVNVFRLNFSHGSHEDHSRILEKIREQSSDLNRTDIAILQDLSGPKVRISEVETGEVELQDNSLIKLAHGTQCGSEECLWVESFDPSEVLQPGNKVSLADGRIELLVESVNSDSVTARISAGGPLRSRSGISVPNVDLKLPCLTEKDLNDLTWGTENNVDFIALSFVSTAADILLLREEIKKRGGDQQIVAKVERASALTHIVDIVDATDAVMVARGDLGIELPLEKVPSAQRIIISTANRRGKPVITATQMLSSMVQEVRPTRAEASDVYTAVRDGTDAVMLSEETAIGKHPPKVIEVISRVVSEAEQQLELFDEQSTIVSGSWTSVPDAVCYAATEAARKVSATAIICCTFSGSSARLISKYRPVQPILGATPSVESCRKMAICWGVEPLLVSGFNDALCNINERGSEVEYALKAAKSAFGLKPGSRVIVTAGRVSHKVGGTNALEVHDISWGK